MTDINVKFHVRICHNGIILYEAIISMRVIFVNGVGGVRLEYFRKKYDNRRF